MGTLRLRQLKVAAVVRVTARRIWLELSASHPSASLWPRLVPLLREPTARRVGVTPSAFSRALGTSSEWKVSLQRVEFGHGREERRFVPPRAAAGFVRSIFRHSPILGAESGGAQLRPFTLQRVERHDRKRRTKV
jgi:hypothetical protein